MDLELMGCIHFFAMVCLGIVVVIRGLTLFIGVEQGQPNTKGRIPLVALQHLSMTIVVLTGVYALYLKDFQVETWFYAKVVLFFVLLSSLGKAFSKVLNIELVQRRAGLFLVVVAFIAILGLVVVQPNLGG